MTTAAQKSPEKLAHASAYDEEFYSNLAAGTRISAKVIVPIVLDLVPANSVVDLGCGVGTWLAEFAARGVKDFLGVDGHHVSDSALEIPRQNFMPWDITQTLSIARRFDLALSLEVAEHLDPTAADDHVEQLTQLAPVVLFSAAIPGQGGTHHVNEQWQSYWAEKFAKQNYRAVDAIRPQLARFSQNVDFWYGQNILLYVKESHISKYGRLTNWIQTTHIDSLAWVHPVLYLAYRDQLVATQFEVEQRTREAYSIRRAITRMPLMLWLAVKARLHSVTR